MGGGTHGLVVAARKVHHRAVALDFGALARRRSKQHAVAPPGHALLEVFVLAPRAGLELVSRGERDVAFAEVVQRPAGELLLPELVV